jgi:hypothetical protein
LRAFRQGLGEADDVEGQNLTIEYRWADGQNGRLASLAAELVRSQAGQRNAIVGNGGQESQCGWCKDRWGISWQITPRVLTDALAAGGDEAKRAFDAMMGMKKIDVATIKAARRG